MVLKREYLYYVYGADSDWTAICVDIDLSVQASTHDEARQKMADVFHSYMEDALKETPENRDRLLNRSSPWTLRLSLWLQYQFFLLRRARPHKRSLSADAFPCPA